MAVDAFLAHYDKKTMTKQLWKALDLDLMDIYNFHARHLSPAGQKAFCRVLKALPIQYISDLVTRTFERHDHFLDHGNGGFANLWY